MVQASKADRKARSSSEVLCDCMARGYAAKQQCAVRKSRLAGSGLDRNGVDSQLASRVENLIPRRRIDRNSVGGALRELLALGFARNTHRVEALARRRCLHPLDERKCLAFEG